MLKLLNQKLANAQQSGEVHLVGGADMCLVFSARKSTRDVDAQFAPTSIIRKHAEKIAHEEGLDKTWLNDAAKGYINQNAEFQDFLELSNLKVLTASPAYLLAMKCLAMRLGPEFHDESDVRYLLRHLNVTEYEASIKLVEQYYSMDLIPEKTRYALEEILAENK